MNKNNTINTRCPAIKGDSKQCEHPAITVVKGYLNQSTFRTFLPEYMAGEGWIKGAASFCGTHANKLTFAGDKTIQVSIKISDFIIQEEKKENTMNGKTIRYITSEEATWIIPFVNFTLLQNAFNKQYMKSYSSRSTYIRENESVSSRDNGKPGYVYCSSEYMGYVGHDGEKFVMVFDRGGILHFIQPMSVFKQQRRVGRMVLPTSNDDRIKTFFETRREALMYQISVKGALFPAENGNGYWVYETKVQG